MNLADKTPSTPSIEARVIPPFQNDSLGSFASNGLSYTIRDMYPKRPLRNFLWNDDFIANVDQFGMGPSWNREGEFESKLCPKELGRLFYLRDIETGEYWSPNRNFARLPFDQFETEVGLGWSRVSAEYKGLRFEWILFVPQQGNRECWCIRITNTKTVDRQIDLFGYMESELGNLEHEAYNHAKFEPALNGVFISHNAYNFPSSLKHHYLATTADVHAYETSNRRFAGVYGSLHAPDALSSGGDLSSIDTSFDATMIGALQSRFELRPGASIEVRMVAGIADSLEAAITSSKEVLASGWFEQEQAAIAGNFETFSERIEVNLPDEDRETELFTNVWLKQQISLGKTWARTYTRGFRDIMQDITAFVGLEPSCVADRICYCLERQRPSGNTLRQWEPIDLHPYRDGPAWIVPAVAGYIKETGDFSLLEREVSYYDSDESATVLDHCLRGMDFLFDGLGAHGLCLWGGGDWNDSLNGAGLQLKGESVWLSQAAIVAAQQFAELLLQLNQSDLAKSYQEKAARLGENLQKHAWDGDHFLCGFTDWGEKVGARENKYAQIFLNMQTWAILAGIAQDPEALSDTIEAELKTDFGYVLNRPSFREGDDHIGRVSYFELGAYENGSVYNHGGAFKIAADCKLGRGQLAYDTLLKILPGNAANPSTASGSEPYAVSNMYLGPENDLRGGEALMSWITGTAGWLLRCVVEEMLGVRPEFDGLRIKPCLPPHWNGVKVKRQFRGSVFNIVIHNPNQLETGALEIRVDGDLIEGNVIPVPAVGSTVSVEVTLSQCN
jgi:cellobiose phosphorylase